MLAMGSKVQCRRAKAIGDSSFNQTDVTILVTCPVGSKTLVCGYVVVIRKAVLLSLSPKRKELTKAGLLRCCCVQKRKDGKSRKISGVWF